MPFVRITVPSGQSPAWRGAVAEAVQEALVATFDVPPDDRFQVVSEHAPGTALIADPGYLGIRRGDGFVAIQITCSFGRSVAQKKALYRTIVERLAAAAGLRPEDVLINLVEVARENWSFGQGEAQYAAP